MGSPTITNCSYNKSSKGDGHRGLQTVITSLKSVPSFVPQKVSTTAGLVLAELSELGVLGEGGREEGREGEREEGEGGRGREGGRERESSLSSHAKYVYLNNVNVLRPCTHICTCTL